MLPEEGNDDEGEGEGPPAEPPKAKGNHCEICKQAYEGPCHGGT